MSKHHDKCLTDNQWRVEIKLAKNGDDAVATADLFLDDAVYEAHGHALRDAVSPSVAEELAVARALSGLAHQLVDDASHEVDRVARAAAGYARDAEQAYEELDA
jgi:hypothetical protein